MRISEERLDEAVLDLVAAHGSGASVCPSEVARSIAAEAAIDWRALLPEVRAAAVRLARERRAVIVRNGAIADPDTFRGIYRIASPGFRPRPRPMSGDPLHPVIVPAAAAAAPKPPPAEAGPAPGVAVEIEDLLGAMLDAPPEPPAYAEPVHSEPAHPDAYEPQSHDAYEGEPALPYGDTYNAPPAFAPEEDEDWDPDLARAPTPATLDDIAGELKHYLAAELDDAPGGDAEIADDVVGLAGEQDEKPVLPSWHEAFRRYLERPSPDEE